MEKKKTLVIGASPKPDRYSFKAVSRLREHGHPVYAFGFSKGTVADVEISSQWPDEKFNTVSLYLNPKRQGEYYQKIIGLKPERVIFNPGTENADLQKLLQQAGIGFEEACTLVLLSTDQY